jgi:GT2 family glycosyltransferase
MVEFSIIILSYNTIELTIKCISSIKNSCAESSYEIWVVDNASTDNSIHAIQEHFPEVHLICNHENVGYARGNNQAMRLARGSIWILLNSDTEIFPDTLTNIREAFQKDKLIGVVGPMLKNKDMSIQPSFGNYISISTEFLFQTFLFKLIPTPFVLGDTIHKFQKRSYQHPHPVDWITGACFAIRKEVAEEVGLLREDLFMYGEDIEWCRRIKKAGNKIFYWPNAKIFHYSRQSSKKNFEDWIRNYTYGHLRFALENLSPFQSRSIGFLICFGSLIRMILWMAMGLTVPNRLAESNQRINGYKEACRMGKEVLFNLSLLKNIS